MNPPDERDNLPSASALEAIELCPGRWQMMKKHPKREDTKDSTYGTNVHKWIEATLTGEQPPTLKTAEEEDAEMLLGKINEIIGDEWNISDIERRFWLKSGETPIFSAKPDIVAIHKTGEEFLILDIKSLWGDHTESASNPQLRGQAVCVATTIGIRKGRVAIVDRFGKPELCHYEPADLMKADLLLRKTLKEADKPDAPRIAGEKQCAYCPALKACPEAQAVVPKMAVTQIHSAEIVSNADLAVLLDRCGLAEKVIGEIKAEAKRRLDADPDAFGGAWILKPGTVKHPITDISTLFTRLNSQLGITDADFIAICSVAKGELKDLIREKTGQKGKGLDSTITVLLDGITEAKPSSPQLVRG